MIGMWPLLAAAASAVLVMAAFRLLVRPPRPLAGRVRPYAVGALAVRRDVAGVRVASGLGVAEVFGPMVDGLARSVDRVVGRSDGSRLALLIRQAGLFRDLPEEERLSAYRLRQLGSVTAWSAVALILAPVLDLSGAQFVGVFVLLSVVGATRQRGSLERAIEQRRSRMIAEIYTVDQVLALRARTGAGVVAAVSAVCERGAGEVIGELDEALRLHRAGMPLGTAFERIAQSTPEPACARTYGLLALADARGVDLAEGLLSLAEDVREERRESMRRAATRRRAAMLIPTIAILAPVMLLFMGAPLPRLLLGS